MTKCGSRRVRQASDVLRLQLYLLSRGDDLRERKLALVPHSELRLMAPLVHKRQHMMLGVGDAPWHDIETTGCSCGYISCAAQHVTDTCMPKEFALTGTLLSLLGPYLSQLEVNCHFHASAGGVSRLLSPIILCSWTPT